MPSCPVQHPPSDRHRPLFALIYGFFEIMMGIEVRRAGKTLDSVVKNAA